MGGVKGLGHGRSIQVLWRQESAQKGRFEPTCKWCITYCFMVGDIFSV